MDHPMTDDDVLLQQPSMVTFRQGVFATTGKGMFRCVWEDVSLNDWVNLVHVKIEAADETIHHDSVMLVPDGSRLDWMMAFSINSTAVFSLIFPVHGGFVSKADFVQARLEGCAGVRSVVDYFEPTAWYEALDQPISTMSLVELSDRPISIVRWAIPFSETYKVAKLLRPRLNFHWLCPDPVLRKRLVLVGGRRHLIHARAILNAARVLGVDLVVIDQQDHWLQPDTVENRKHREAFIALDMTDDEQLSERITDALLTHPQPVDGIVTHNDNYFVAVARVATVLNLPTSPVSALETTTDKYKSRMLQDEPGKTALVSSLNELYSLMGQPSFNPVFPLIVKPTKGWASQCVSKVTTLKDLPLAVHKAVGRHGSPAVIEPFFKGPEIDVNLVLLDGEVLFSEVTDEPPCEAEAQGASINATFTSETMTIPSALPLEEVELAKNTMRNLLLKIGCHTGVFHAEARIVNSTVEYGRVYSYRDLDNGIDSYSSDDDASGESIVPDDFDRDYQSPNRPDNGVVQPSVKEPEIFDSSDSDFVHVPDLVVPDLVHEHNVVVHSPVLKPDAVVHDSVHKPDVIANDIIDEHNNAVQKPVNKPEVVHDPVNIADSLTVCKRVGLKLVDVIPKPSYRMPQARAECRMLEINARPPGFSVSVPIRFVHGIDYFAIHMLASLGEHDRLRRAATPFDFSRSLPVYDAPTAQCWSQLVCISAPAAGIVHSDSPCEDLKRLQPDLAGHITFVNEYFRKGDRIELYKDGVRVRVADIVVIHPRSRREVVELGERVRQGYRMDIR
ncbi:hypothetical protein CP533_5219 [Ophiocordyceps camponoti-saundersi (nom. inval.)]|nr:hypothetical protein CP533_5219 [Ophiocordyceps camponoti-saundersi (nom. inval.)]